MAQWAWGLIGCVGLFRERTRNKWHWSVSWHILVDSNVPTTFADMVLKLIFFRTAFLSAPSFLAWDMWCRPWSSYCPSTLFSSTVWPPRLCVGSLRYLHWFFALICTRTFLKLSFNTLIQVLIDLIQILNIVGVKALLDDAMLKVENIIDNDFLNIVLCSHPLILFKETIHVWSCCFSAFNV